MTFFYLFFGVYIVANIYVFIGLRRWIGPGFWQWPVALWFVAMIATWGLRFGSPTSGILIYVENAGYVWMGFILITAMCFLAVNAAAIILKLLAFFTAHSFTRVLSKSRRVALALVLGLGFSVYAVIEAQTIGITQYTIFSEKLVAGQAFGQAYGQAAGQVHGQIPDQTLVQAAGQPPKLAAERLRIVLLADIHLSSYIGERTLTRMVTMVNGLEPDIIVMAGDLIDSDLSADELNAPILASMQARLGKFAVTGNHEAYHGLPQAEAFMRKADLQLLRNEIVPVGEIMVAGVDDISVVTRYPGREQGRELGREQGRELGRELGTNEWNPTPLLKSYQGNKFVLLMKHRPSVSQDALGWFDLQVSGHTHGGQIWPGKYVAQHLHNSLAQGLSEFVAPNGQTSRLILSNGVGFWGPPMRLFTPPEIVVIDLLPARVPAAATFTTTLTTGIN